MTIKEKQLVSCKLDQVLYHTYLARELKFYLDSELRIRGRDLELNIITYKPSVMIKNKAQHVRNLKAINARLWPNKELELKINFILAAEPHLYPKFYFDSIAFLAKRDTGGKANPFSLAQKTILKRPMTEGLEGLVIRVKGKRGSRKNASTYTKGLVKRAGKFLRNASRTYTGQLVDSRGATGLKITTTLKKGLIGLKAKTLTQ